MFKKLLILFSFLLGMSSLIAMEGNVLERSASEGVSSVLSLKKLCMGTICENIEKFTPEYIASLSADARNIFMLRAAINVIGKVPCKMIAQLDGHTGPVYAACRSHDNKVITASGDNTLRIWDIKGTCVATCAGHTDAVWSVCVTPDNRIISGSEDCTIRIWNMQGEPLAVFEGHEDAVTGLCLSPDNELISCSGDGTIRIWNNNGTHRIVCNGHTEAVWAICLTQENNIVSCSEDGTVRVWNRDGKQLAICNGHTKSVPNVCMSSNNKIISCSNDWSIRMWELDGTQRALFVGHKRPVSAVRLISRDILASSSVDKKVLIWDMSGQPIAVCKCPTPLWSFARIDEHTIVATGEDHHAYIFDMRALYCLKDTTATLAKSVWAFLQELIAIQKTGYVAKLNATACWERIQKLKEEDDQRLEKIAEPENKRYKAEPE